MRVGTIWKETAQAHGVRPDEIPGDGRSPRLCKARAEAAHRMQNELGMSLSEIARRLDRHHTTVLHMLRKFHGASVPGNFDPGQPDYSGEWAI